MTVAPRDPAFNRRKLGAMSPSISWIVVEAFSLGENTPCGKPARASKTESVADDAPRSVINTVRGVAEYSLERR
jgi:hypothetical protein